MIQRIQSIYFLLAAASFGALFILPLAQSDKAAGSLLSDQAYTISDHPALLGLTILGSLIALLGIFVFKNRPLQVKLGFGVVLLAVVLPMVALFVLNNAISVTEASVIVTNQAGLFVPAGAVLFGILAILNIRKDEHLVKSMDRLR